MLQIYYMSPQEPPVIEPDFQIILGGPEQSLYAPLPNPTAQLIIRSANKLSNWIFTLLNLMLIGPEAIPADHPFRQTPMFNENPNTKYCLGRIHPDTADADYPPFQEVCNVTVEVVDGDDQNDDQGGGGNNDGA